MIKRAGRTVKLSISVDQVDLDLLKKQAKRSTNGNISGVIADMIRLARELEGRKTLAAWLGAVHEEPSEKAIRSIRAEWRTGQQSRKRTRAA